MKLTGPLSAPFSGGGMPFDGSSTWAARGVGSAVGALKLISDVGDTSAGGTLMRWNGTYWRVLAPTYAIHDPTPGANGDLIGNDQIVKSAAMPAGLLRACREFIIRATFGKSGTVDASSFVRVRLGPAGTVADPFLWENAPGLASGNRSWPAETTHILTTATNVRQVGPLNLSGWVGGGTSFSSPQDKAVSDVDANALTLSLSIDMNGTTDAPQGLYLALLLMP